MAEWARDTGADATDAGDVEAWAACDRAFTVREERQALRLIDWLLARDASENAEHATAAQINAHERTHEGAASHALDDALLAVEAKRHGYARDEVAALVDCDLPAQMRLRLLTEEE